MNYADNKNDSKGILALLFSILLFSTIELVSKNIQDKGAFIDPFILVFIRFFVTGIILLLIGLPGRLKEGLVLQKKDFAIFLLNGIIGISLSITLFHVSILMFRNASSSAVVFSSNPIFVAMISPFINKKVLHWKDIIAIIIGSLGIGCFVFETGTFSGVSAKGMLVMLSSAFFFATSICISKKYIYRYGPLVMMGFSSLFGSIFVLPLGLLRSGVHGYIDIPKVLPQIAYIVLMGTALAYGLYYYGLNRTSAYKASITFFLKPVLAFCFAIVLRGEHANIYTVSGTLMILVAMGLSLMRGNENGTRRAGET